MDNRDFGQALRETRAVQPRTVFGDAPCLKLSVDGYTFRGAGKVSVNGIGESAAGLRASPGGECFDGCLGDGCRIRRVGLAPPL